MSLQRFVGIILLVAGVALFVMGMNATDSIADRLSTFVSGNFTETTTWYLVGGGAGAIIGLALLLVGGRRRS